MVSLPFARDRDIWILDGLRPPQTWWTRLTGRR
jgi:hypothetical protein